MIPEEITYQETRDKIMENTVYDRKNAGPRSWMSVKEMGDMLGLKKTDRYWLLHKGFFESKVAMGKTWVNIDSFEKWYANQVKYKKVNGEEPGRELRERSYSAREIAEMLQICESVAYDLINQNNIETITVDYWKRVPKEAFEKWYHGQSRYRTKEDKARDAEIEAATISMPEMARLLGVTRSAVYTLLSRSNYSHLFEVVVVADRKRITKESFQKFLESQDRYRLDPRNKFREVSEEDNKAIADYRRRTLARNNNVRKDNGNLKYLTRKEAALMAKVHPATVTGWMQKGKFPVVKTPSTILIPRREYEEWLLKRRWRKDKWHR